MTVIIVGFHLGGQPVGTALEVEEGGPLRFHVSYAKDADFFLMQSLRPETSGTRAIEAAVEAVLSAPAPRSVDLDDDVGAAGITKLIGQALPCIPTSPSHSSSLAR